MKGPPDATDHHLFVIRLTSQGTLPGEMQGAVEHVKTRRRMLFTTWSQLRTFIELHLECDLTGGGAAQADSEDPD